MKNVSGNPENWNKEKTEKIKKTKTEKNDNISSDDIENEIAEGIPLTHTKDDCILELENILCKMKILQKTICIKEMYDSIVHIEMAKDCLTR